MAELQSMIAEANRLMDESQWAEARSLYRAVFSLGLPNNSIWVSNLRFAEKYERVQFWETLWEKYPESYRVWENLMIVLVEARQLGEAVRLCTSILQGDHSSFRDERAIRKVRWFRLKAVLGAFGAYYRGSYQTLLEDLPVLWAASSRKDMIQALTGLADPKAIATLEMLIEEAWPPAPLKQFLAAKIDQLLAAEELINAFSQEERA